MTSAEVPQPISSVPVRWGGFTAHQLGWLAAGAAMPYLLLRLHLSPAGAFGPSAPWLGTAVCFAFGRSEGRRLDAWVGDWVWFKLQPHRLSHPDALASLPPAAGYVPVDRPLRDAGRGTTASLPWESP
ncbi:MAG TPA: PrgI family protein [Candidatus Dormibacteraeota bacterium]|nr:PrgI family protein [Candidatus Dormibacteraeota bacterium]